MPISRITKYRGTGQYTITDTLGTTQEIPFADFAAGIIYIPAASTLTALAFYCSPRQDSDPDALTPAGNTQPAQNYYQLADNTNTLISQTVTAGRSYAFPAGCFAAGAVKIVGTFSAGASSVAEISAKT